MIRTAATISVFILLAFAPAAQAQSQYDALVARHAAANGVPEALVRRVIVRESRYNPRAIGKDGAMGMMQIKTATAHAMGYTGGPAGLLDADVNMTYAVKYLAGAYRAAKGNHDLAVSYYARGYYYQAKAQGFSPYGATTERRSRLPARAAWRVGTAPTSEFMR
ncbi:MAG TPA: transglycosylase SLT domain-containing protein [Xanthobacteraceae bacterium]|jgi:soluble lytic murein transglycosylase-like protein